LKTIGLVSKLLSGVGAFASVIRDKHFFGRVRLETYQCFEKARRLRKCCSQIFVRQKRSGSSLCRTPKRTRGVRSIPLVGSRKQEHAKQFASDKAGNVC